METINQGFTPLGNAAKRVAHGLVVIAENRFELLTVEMQEEREHFLHAILLALGVAVFGILGLIALTAAIVVLLWAYSPAGVLLGLTALHGAIAACFFQQLKRRSRDWQCLPATLDQLKRDRVTFETLLA